MDIKFSLYGGSKVDKDAINYPDISEHLIKCLQRDFPDTIPREEISAYQYGVKVGQQLIIDKLIYEKTEQEEKRNV